MDFIVGIAFLFYATLIQFFTVVPLKAAWITGVLFVVVGLAYGGYRGKWWANRT